VVAEAIAFKSCLRNRMGQAEDQAEVQMERATWSSQMALMVAGAGFEPATFGL
jgi:hypothetical protein